MTDLIQAFAIQQLLNRFANSFDLKEWDALGDCLADTVFTDYSALRGTPPETITRERFVALRREALDALGTHHLAGNHEISIKGDEADARLSMLIYRKRPDGEVLDTHCLYQFQLALVAGAWRITGITQKVLWNDGNAAIHVGAAQFHAASTTRQ